VFIYDLYLHVAFVLFAVLGRRGILIGLPFFKNEDFEVKIPRCAAHLFL
jgi:hypothetical protein